jgi:hypothetical protein
MVVVCCGHGKSFFQNFLGGYQQHSCHVLMFLRAKCSDCATEVAGGAAKIAKSRPDVQGRRFHAVVGESVFLVAHAGWVCHAEGVCKGTHAAMQFFEYFLKQ